MDLGSFLSQVRCNPLSLVRQVHDPATIASAGKTSRLATAPSISYDETHSPAPLSDILTFSITEPFQSSLDTAPSRIVMSHCMSSFVHSILWSSLAYYAMSVPGHSRVTQHSKNRKTGDIAAMMLSEPPRLFSTLFRAETASLLLNVGLFASLQQVNQFT
jgi:hypothetical protein